MGSFVGARFSLWIATLVVAALPSCAVRPSSLVSTTPSCVAPNTYQCSKAPAYANVTYGTTVNTINPLHPPVTLLLDAYLPQSFGVTPRGPGIVFIHGGGFTAGDKTDTGNVWVSNDLAASGYIVYSIDYRLDPCLAASCSNPYSGTGRYLDPALDMLTAIKWAKSVNPKVGGNGNIGLVGGSAGGVLADLGGLRSFYDGASVLTAISLSGPGETRLDHILDVSTGLPPTDTSETGSTIDNWIGCPFWTSTDPAACPEKFASVSPTALANLHSVPILQVAATQDHTLNFPIYNSVNAFGQALAAFAVPTAVDVPTITNCHSTACWYSLSITTGRTIEADSLLWLHKYLG